MPKQLPSVRTPGAINPIPLFVERPCSWFRMLHWSILSAAVLPSPLTPFVPLGSQPAIARNGGPGRPTGRCLGTLPWTTASTMAGLRAAARTAGFLSLLILSSGVANAQMAAPVTPVERSSLMDSLAGSITEASQRFGVPSRWIRAVMQIESRGDSRATSPKGAMGLMQLMPEAWADLRARLDLGTDAYDPHDNILAGAAYLRELHDRFGDQGFFAAYNAGPGRYEDYLATGRPLPAETRAYVAQILPLIGTQQINQNVALATTPLPWRQAPLFVGHAITVASTSGQAAPDGPSNRGSNGDSSAIMPLSNDLFVSRAKAGALR